MLMLACLFLAADDPPESIRVYLTQRDEQAAAEVKRLDAEIRRLAGDRRKNSRELIAKLKKRRDEIKKDPSSFVPQVPYQFCILKAGEIGSIAQSEYGSNGGRSAPVITAIQIVDEENMLVELTWSYHTFVATSNEGGRMEFQKTERRVWLRGFPTSKLANGSKVSIPEMVEVTGNHSYETVSGAIETVLVIEPFDKAKLEPYLKPAKQKAARRPAHR